IPDTTPSNRYRVRASSRGPKRSGSINAIGRAPIEKMSRMMPPTPVAAPWYGSTADGWLWLSMRTATAMPSPTSMTPAPSPGPTSTHGASVGRRPRWERDDLYEQCSDHITEYMASSRCVGSRPSSSTTAASSSSVMPSWRWSGCSLISPALGCAGPLGPRSQPVGRSGVSGARSRSELVAEVGGGEHRDVGDAPLLELTAERPAPVEQQRRRDDLAAEVADRVDRLQQRRASGRGV